MTVAVRGFDVFDQMAAAAVVAGTTPRTPTAPTAPAPTAPTQAAQGRSLMQRLSQSLLFNASVVLGVFAGIVYALGTILSATPLGQVTPAQDVFLWGGVILGALAVAGMMTAVLVATVVRATA